MLTKHIRIALFGLLALLIVSSNVLADGMNIPAAPGGSTGQLQFNNSGSFAGTTIYQISATDGTLLAQEHVAGSTPVLVDIYPSATFKPDEGAAGTAGTIAWAAAQLSSGGQIFVHAGTYTVSTTITISTAGTALFCADPQTTILKAANSFNAVMVKLGWAGAQRQGMEVMHCQFQGSSGANTTETELWIRDTAYANVQDNYFNDAAPNGVVLDATVSGAVQNRLTDNNFSECKQECLILNGAGSNATDSLISGNSIGGSVTGDSTKPWVTINGLGSLQWIGNHISGPTHTSCMIFTGGGQTDVSIVGNEFETCPQYGLVMAGSSAAITGNLFYGNGTATTNTYAQLYLQSSTNNTITGNSFRGNSVSKQAIFSDQGTAHNVIAGNIFTGHVGNAVQFANGFAGAIEFGLNDFSFNGGTISQAGAHYFPNSIALAAPAGLGNTPGQLNVNGVLTTQLGTGQTPVITTSGTTGAGTWTYVVVPKDINGNAAPASAAASTTTGNATLTGSNFNIITFAPTNGAQSYDIYRTASGGTPSSLGLIGNVLATAIQASAFTTTNYSFNDTGLAGNSATAPSVNQSGSAVIAGPIKFTGTIPAVSGTGTPTITSGSTDTSGEVTSGTSGTSVVVTFASAKTNAPFCTVTPQTQLLAFAYTISTTAITVTQTATTGEKIDYVCAQH